MSESVVGKLIGPRSGKPGRGLGAQPGAPGDGEALRPGATPQRAYVTGMTVALAGIVLYFMALVSAFIVRRNIAGDEWLPLQIPVILWVTTPVLILSSFTIVRAGKRLKAGDEDGFRLWWNFTAALGIFFFLGQVSSWVQLSKAGLELASNPSSGFFYVFTASHAIFLLGGFLAITSVAFWLPRHLSRATAIEVLSMYWHFLDGLWVFLFLLLLLGK
ncbi:MAG: cytochrome c oxidase subunit 3 [Candidatus Acidiferrales bacterium]